MIEDNVPSDIWFASTRTNELGVSKGVELFASLSDPGAEGTGIYFSPTDPETLYVNIQHSEADDGDGTWAITKKRYHRGRRSYRDYDSDWDRDSHGGHRNARRAADGPCATSALRSGRVKRVDA
jgi:secreted PhoX family phosphatase